VITRSTDKLIALQFLAVVLPIAVVLLMQMAADAHRAAALEHSRPLRMLAEDARANYKTFTNGAADAVDSGALGGQSVDALRRSLVRLQQLADRGETAVTGEAPEVVAGLARALPTTMPLSALLPLREQIMRGDRLTKSIHEEFQRRDEAVVIDAIESAVRQKREVTAALFVTAVLTVVFVLATRRRLKRRLEADAAIERRRRVELETISIRFGVATQAARAGVYEVEQGTGEVWWSETMFELYGREPASYRPTLAGWLELIHADDRAAARSAMVRALHDRKQLRIRYRAVRPDGTTCHLESLAAVVSDALDSRPRLVGIDLDVSERVEAEGREHKLQEQLRDASRNAGMAEVATNVLHNVGNVLNSVNVSASLVMDRVKAARIGSFGRVAAMLQEHQHDLAEFVTSDERARHLPDYLAQLAKHLAAEQTSTVLELESLRKNIEHIKEIVTMQQRYAKLAGVAETVSVAALVEDSLRLNNGSSAPQAVTFAREFDPVPPIMVDKHKVLQILVNLVRNARHACEAAAKGDQRITVRVANRDAGVQIAVTDTGIGIPPENLTRIFNHGFTTKKNGHGFGLHSGALAARELGGALRAASEGPGRGATFTLDLPLNPPEFAHG
jgi:signal transduction histidine kinase